LRHTVLVQLMKHGLSLTSTESIFVSIGVMWKTTAHGLSSDLVKCMRWGKMRCGKMYNLARAFHDYNVTFRPANLPRIRPTLVRITLFCLLYTTFRELRMLCSLSVVIAE